jgi:hypothetical protein
MVKRAQQEKGIQICGKRKKWTIDMVRNVREGREEETGSLTKSMELILLEKPTATQEFPNILWNLRFMFVRVHH